MGAKVIILAKSLIPIYLRACAIVHCDLTIKSETGQHLQFFPFQAEMMKAEITKWVM